MLGGRCIKTVLGAVFEKRHYLALRNMARVYDHPLDMLVRYLRQEGRYPITVRLRTPTGVVAVTLYTHHDLLTVNEIFCRLDYDVGQVSTVVDFGSNIGISALYFLTRNANSRIKLFEPLPTNIARLRQNLKDYEGRYELLPVAIGTEDGQVEFAYEPSGRYGGIGRRFESKLMVQCLNANSAIARVLSEPGFERIDLLKIDIEGIEIEVLRTLDPALLAKISNIVVEVESTPPTLQGFSSEFYGPVVRWKRQSSCS